MKRTIDIVVATAALLLVWPLILIAVLMLRLRGRGQPIEALPRLGRDGRRFAMYRVRITPGGRAPRRLSLAIVANLPQLLNVLKGDMSLLGPRPLAPERARGSGPLWRQVLAVRPGLFSLSQVLLLADTGGARYGALVPDCDAEARMLPVQLHLDLYYVEHWSILLDFQIIGLGLLLLARSGRYVTVV